MSTHTTKTQQVVALPCEQRVQTALDTLKQLQNELDFAKIVEDRHHATVVTMIRKMTTEINKLRLVLEAK